MKCGWKEEFFIRLLISQCNKNHFLPHYLTAFHSERAKVIDLDDKSTTYTSIKALGPLNSGGGNHKLLNIHFHNFGH